jgi:P-type conjugative transfer protein TrbG
MKPMNNIFLHAKKTTLALALAGVMAATSTSALASNDGSSAAAVQAARALANAHGGPAPSAGHATNSHAAASSRLFSATPRVGRVDQALDHARDAYLQGNSAKPIVAADGRVLYPHQSDIYPQIDCGPLRACSIELQPGERVIATVLGDTARWHTQLIDAANPQQVIIKPTESGIETNLSIVTDRRTYYMDIASKDTHYVPRIGWYYPSELVTQYQQAQAAQVHEAKQTIASVAPTALDFEYSITGFGTFVPTQAFNDGRQTFFRMPAGNYDMPGVVAVREGDTALVNARVKDGYLIVDGTHHEYALIAGGEMVNIVRGDRKPTLETKTSAGTEKERASLFSKLFGGGKSTQPKQNYHDCQSQTYDWWNCEK